MYLSRVQLSPSLAEQKQLARLLSENSYGIHQILWDLFEGDERFLFREESSREQLLSKRNLPVYYLLSKVRPAQDNPIFLVETKIFEPRLNPGDRLAFRLRANPTVARKTEGQKRGKRHDVLMDAQYHWLREQCELHGLPVEGGKGQLKQSLVQEKPEQFDQGQIETRLQDVSQTAARSWLIHRGTRLGFDIYPPKLHCNGYRWNLLHKKQRGAGFSSVDYRGELLVTEPELFIKNIFAGMGPAKAFGCGLMLIRRI
ncbi:type I-E CRISPR-associated protein Cas6/Cse3/CasE [Microbulbifer sp. JMSA004]|uniref:type I-E CRISPR-associated protein Cas6/Cse3/CasE n=1 Tax=Microbulbifer sp. JMSA004 TaxID=3243370 RepID=UPI00403961C2